MLYNNLEKCVGWGGEGTPHLCQKVGNLDYSKTYKIGDGALCFVIVMKEEPLFVMLFYKKKTVYFSQIE